jgi:hypothetical protein
VGSVASGALLDTQQIGQLIELWIPGNPDTREDERLVLSVQTVAFRPMITVSKDSTVDGLNHVFKIDGHLFDQFSQQPQPFVAFLKKYWNQAHSALFLFQLQPVIPGLHCGVIHARPKINRKGTSEIVSLLFSLKRQLESEFHFDVCGSAFDGDSYFNTLHHGFHLGWMNAFQANPQVSPEISMRPVVITDPLHLTKQIRYRWIHGTFPFGIGKQELLFFSIKPFKSQVSVASRVSAVTTS